jgi:bifunctional pyridoxal-dependent enzyme with beta-cystathionase and maltose regulon repressor activities
MKYDFTTILDRHGKDAIAVDSIPIKGATVDPQYSIIPMWVADMNYPVFENIQTQIIKRVNEPHFGYFNIPQAYYDAIKYWQKEVHNVEVEQDAIGYENGVLGILASALHAFTSPGEKILIQSPTYIGFSHVVEDNGRVIVHSPLIREKNWEMDYEDLETKIKENDIHFVVFCSPHNPTGRVWRKEEIEKFMAICKKYDCIVFSDEIWSDIVRNENTHIPTQSINEDAKQRTIAAYAPSKTFNLAGLVGSYHIIYNKYLRDRVNKEADLSYYNSANILSVHALIGALCPEGKEWVKELNDVIAQNVDYAVDFIQSHFEGIKVTKPQGTYMLYLDCTDYLATHDISMDDLLKKGVRYGILWQDGRPFESPNTIRLNLALPFSLVQKAFDRLEKHVL